MTCQTCRHADFTEVFSLNEAQTKENACVSVIYYAGDMLSQDLQFAYPLEDRTEQTQLIKWLKKTRSIIVIYTIITLKIIQIQKNSTSQHVCLCTRSILGI